MENLDTLGLPKLDLSRLGLLNLQPESLSKGPSLAPAQTTGNATLTAKDEYVLFQR